MSTEAARTIGFVGGGNMAQAMIAGLIANGAHPQDIRVSDPSPETRRRLEDELGIRAMPDNRAVAADADLLVLAVKPQVLGPVAREIADAVNARQPVVLSIAAGIEISSMESWLGATTAVVRAMPNSPCLLRRGITALYANANTSNRQRTLASQALEGVGSVIWLEREDLMDAVTAASGSGPAYFFLFMEAMEHSARGLGLPLEVARALVLHTAAGAARMALESGQDLAQLRRNVTSPGGTTAAALALFEDGGLRELVEQALTGARDRGREIAQEFGQG